jgi:hypothetical protein
MKQHFPMVRGFMDLSSNKKSDKQSNTERKKRGKEKK